MLFSSATRHESILSLACPKFLRYHYKLFTLFVLMSIKDRETRSFNFIHSGALRWQMMTWGRSVHFNVTHLHFKKCKDCCAGAVQVRLSSVQRHKSLCRSLCVEHISWVRCACRRSQCHMPAPVWAKRTVLTDWQVRSSVSELSHTWSCFFFVLTHAVRTRSQISESWDNIGGALPSTPTFSRLIGSAEGSFLVFFSFECNYCYWLTVCMFVSFPAVPVLSGFCTGARSSVLWRNK